MIKETIKVAVLMSTYNGREYIEEQIKSILKQKKVNVQLFCRDDGSHDGTQKILDEYAAMYKNISVINCHQQENVGVKNSFMKLLSFAVDITDAEYFAFADQDDVWLEDKLISAVRLIEQTGNSLKGSLYYSNKTYVDDKLNIIGHENNKFYNDIYEVFFRSIAFGNTMVFDRRLAELVLLHKLDIPILHDSLIYHVAKCIGSNILFDKNSHILYRQHEDNVVGIEGSCLYNDNLFFMVKRALPLLFAKRENKKSIYIEAISGAYDNYLPKENKLIIGLFMSYRKNIISKLKLIFNKEIRRRDFKTRMFWVYVILFNRL